jgi:hypothetical protein
MLKLQQREDQRYMPGGDLYKDPNAQQGDAGGAAGGADAAAQADALAEMKKQNDVMLAKMYLSGAGRNGGGTGGGLRNNGSALFGAGQNYLGGAFGNAQFNDDILGQLGQFLQKKPEEQYSGKDAIQTLLAQNMYKGLGEQWTAPAKKAEIKQNSPMISGGGYPQQGMPQGQSHGYGGPPPSWLTFAPGSQEARAQQGLGGPLPPGYVPPKPSGVNPLANDTNPEAWRGMGDVMRKALGLGGA